MVSPLHFGFNYQTASTNIFQSLPLLSPDQLLQAVQLEWKQVTAMLQQAGIQIFSLPDNEELKTPDSVFPNNWISFHSASTMVLYPMKNKNRRWERRTDVIQKLIAEMAVQNVIDLTHYENEGKYLEGTGSIVFDHSGGMAYMNRSSRSNEFIFYELCEKLMYQPVVFSSSSPNGDEIYHTNVLMAIGTTEAIICSEVIDAIDREQVLSQLNINKTIVEISYSQLCSFAGNMLQLTNNSAKNFWVMSDSAKRSLTKKQIEILSQNNDLLSVPIPQIEQVGGGSIRCLLCELFQE